jgi:hypothetical protein
MNNCNNAQLEFTLQENAFVHRPARHRRATRAAWWFARMREVVDAALEWNAAPAGRPEQLVMPGTRR